jgi:hypothetical protein
MISTVEATLLALIKVGAVLWKEKFLTFEVKVVDSDCLVGLLNFFTLFCALENCGVN